MKLRIGATIATETEVNENEIEKEISELGISENSEIEVFLKTEKLISILYWEGNELKNLIKTDSGTEISEADSNEIQAINEMNFSKFGLKPYKFWPNSRLGKFLPFINKYTNRKPRKVKV